MHLRAVTLTNCAVLLAAALLAGCLGSGTADSDAKRDLAECQLSSRSAEGAVFRQNYINERRESGEEAVAPRKGDASYREYILLCMEALGHSFRAPSSDAIEKGDRCWTVDKAGILPDAQVDDGVCYE